MAALPWMEQSPAAVLCTDMEKSVGESACPSASACSSAMERASSPWRLTKMALSTWWRASRLSPTCTASREPWLRRRAIIMGSKGVAGNGGSTGQRPCCAHACQAASSARPGDSA